MFRTLPPIGVPISIADILAGIISFLKGDSYIKRFREELCRYFGVKYCFLASSGRAVLTMLLMAMRNLQSEKDEVILPAYTSFFVPSAVVKAGLKVSLCDIDPNTMSLDINSLKESITESTLCVVVCPLFGYPCDMDAIMEVAKERGVYVIDDSAQAMGAKYKGKYLGIFGDAGIFSLSRGKNITTVDGGIIVTNSNEMAEELSKIDLKKAGYLDRLMIIFKALIISVFLRPCFYWLPGKLPFLNLGVAVFSTNFCLKELTEIQAGMGIRMLKRLKTINETRALKADKLIKGLGSSKGINFSRKVDGAEPVFLRLPIRCNNSNQLDYPRLGIVKSYPYPLNKIEPLKPYIINGKRYPNAERLAENILTLPTHNYVTRKDINLIINYFRE